MNYEFFMFINEIAIPFVFSAISIYVLPIVKNFIIEKDLNSAVKIGVEAVEQYMLTQEGSVKKQAVKDFVLSKFDISDQQLDILIESAVFELNN